MKTILHNFKRISAIFLAVIICFMSAVAVNASSTLSGSWKKNDTGWWYEYSDGTYPKSQWLTLSDKKYYFNSEGYAVTGWQTIRNKKYLFDDNCAMLTGWQKVDNDWYYMYKTGEMLTGWQKTDSGFDYFDYNGRWIEDTAYDDSFIFGIDVSKWQGDIDWRALKDEGVKFAFVRVGHGDNVIDPKFDANMKAAEEAGILTGVYFYSTATNEIESLRDAQFVIDSLDGYLVSYPVVIDVEDEDTQGELSKKQLGMITKTFCDEISAAGYTPMIYCNEYWYKDKIDTTLIPGVYKWIARWNGKYDTAIERDVWQVGETGRINGIDEYVDFDFALTDFSKLITPMRQKADSYIPQKGVWYEDSIGRWYSYIEGDWAIGWEQIGKDWYYFDQRGYMCTGWINDGKAYYYLEADGVWSGHKKDDITDPTVHTNLTEIEGIEVTCTEDGLMPYYKCEDCGRLFSDKETTNEISLEDTVIKSTGHSLTHYDAKGATCFDDGYKAHDKCDNCEKIFIDGVEVNQEDIKVTAAHIIEHIDYKEPQVGIAGVYEHDRCTSCDKIFMGGMEVTKEEIIIPALPYPQEWKSNNRGWWYQYSDGSYAVGWDKIDNEWYYFDQNGYMQTGWIYSGNKWYYLKKSGAMQTSWLNLNGIWYYLDDSGAMITGWEQVKSIWYYFNTDGEMQTDWQYIGGKWYYFKENGAMITGWLKQDSVWYYLNSSGAMVTGNVNIDGKIYRFNSSGAWIG